jgi:LysM repeat protein
MKNSFHIALLAAALPVYTFATTPFDSLALENDKGKLYVIHKVEKKETLFRLLRRYHCKPAEIMAANPTLDGSSTIYENQVLRVPYKTKSGKKVDLLKNEDNNIDKDLKSTLHTATEEPKKLYHVVSIGETVYAISKIYEVTPEQLRKANNLPDNTISVGQKILVSRDYVAASPAADGEEFRVRKLPSAPTDYVPNAPRGIQVKEVGIATTIGVKNSSNNNWAMHRTAPIGSEIKVENEATGAFVIAKVIGKLQETGNNQNVLVRLTPSAFNKLKPRDNRIRASVTYEVPRRN